MHTTNNKIEWATKKGKSALWMLLAILMFVISCPFKRLLQAEGTVHTATEKSVRWNSNERGGAVSKAAFCCAQKQKITLVKFTVGKQELPSPDFVADLNIQTGFSIQYFLSGTEQRIQSFDVSAPSALPLFLQHRRLLI